MLIGPIIEVGNILISDEPLDLLLQRHIVNDLPHLIKLVPIKSFAILHRINQRLPPIKGRSTKTALKIRRKQLPKCLFNLIEGFGMARGRVKAGEGLLFGALDVFVDLVLEQDVVLVVAGGRGGRG